MTKYSLKFNLGHLASSQDLIWHLLLVQILDVMSFSKLLGLVLAGTELIQLRKCSDKSTGVNWLRHNTTSCLQYTETSNGVIAANADEVNNCDL